jgi:hypothetical protein
VSQGSKAKVSSRDINIELMMKFPWLQKINEYKIDELESKVLMKSLHDNFKTHPFKIVEYNMRSIMKRLNK